MKAKERSAPAPAAEPVHPPNGHPAEAREPARPPDGPPPQLDGIEEFGPTRNWISFDAQRGRFTCRTLQDEYEEFVGYVVASRVVRVMKDEDGNVHCASSDRIAADTGRPGRLCEPCEDRDAACFLRWLIGWQEKETGLLFAHTLSQTGSLNFQRYASSLLQENLLPSQVLTRIFVEEARRLKTNTLYRRVQFERLDPVEPEAVIA